jgi:hypothetical protein
VLTVDQEDLVADEKTVKEETDFWGNKQDVIYENGRKVGTVSLEEKGGFFGFGAETVKVERDLGGNETSHTKNEERGSFFGFGGERTEVRYSPSGEEIGTSKVEKRGEFFGFGGEHVRVERTNDGEESGQTHWERRGGFLGFGGERVRVTRQTNRSDGQGRQHSGGSGYSASSGSSGGTILPLIALICIVAISWPVLTQLLAPSQQRPEPTIQDNGALEKGRLDALKKYNFDAWPVGKTLTFENRAFSFCTRQCNSSGGVLIRLASIERSSIENIELTFEVDTPPKNAKKPGGFANRSASEYLLFVFEDSFSELGFGRNAKKFPYGEALHLLDGKGNRVTAIDGIEGLRLSEFNSKATRALLPYGQVSEFWVTFPLPASGTQSLKFVSPSLHGHQNGWTWTIY